MNAKDLYQIWLGKYQERYHSSYSSSIYVGKDLHVLKETLDRFGQSISYLAIVYALENNYQSVESIKKFAESLEKELPFPDIEYWTLTKGKTEQKEMYHELIALENKWFPSPEDLRRKKQIVENLQTWIEIVKK